MKVHVVHDPQGTILSLAVPGPGYVDKMGIVANQGELVTVVEQPDVEGQQLYRRLREINEQYRIDVMSGTLVKK